MYIDDTIAAIATPPGIGGVGIIRVSGKDSFPIVNSLFKSAGTVPLMGPPKIERFNTGPLWIQQRTRPSTRFLCY